MLSVPGAEWERMLSQYRDIVVFDVDKRECPTIVVDGDAQKPDPAGGYRRAFRHGQGVDGPHTGRHGRSWFCLITNPILISTVRNLSQSTAYGAQN
jgi:hypothetical protein